MNRWVVSGCIYELNIFLKYSKDDWEILYFFVVVAFHKEEQLLSHMSVHLKPYSTDEDDELFIQEEPLGIPIIVSLY